MKRVRHDEEEDTPSFVFVPAKGFESTHEIRFEGPRRTVVRSKITGRNLKVSKTGRVLLCPARRWELVQALIPPGASTVPFEPWYPAQPDRTSQFYCHADEPDAMDDSSEGTNEKNKKRNVPWRAFRRVFMLIVLIAVLVAYITPETVNGIVDTMYKTMYPKAAAVENNQVMSWL